MALITIFLAVVSVTTPTLEELSQRTEPWVREDVTITSVSEFHTSDFLREDEPVLLLHHAFLDDENETLRTVVCTDTRVFVLEEGIVQREIPLVHPVSRVATSPSGTYLVAHRETEIPTEIRSLRINTETREQIVFSSHPGMTLTTDVPGVWLRDDGSLFSATNDRASSAYPPLHTFFFDTSLSFVTGPVMPSFGTYIASSIDAELVFIHAAATSLRGVAYDRSGNLLWRMQEGVSGLISVVVSKNGQLVGLATRHGVILIDGVTGNNINEYSNDTVIGELILSPSSNRAIYRQVEPRAYTTVNLETQESIATEVSTILWPHSLTDDGTILLASGRTNSYILLDHDHSPMFALRSENSPFPISLSLSGNRFVHSIAAMDGLPSFTLFEMKRGN